VTRLDSVERDRGALGRIVASGQASDFEFDLYEWFADPDVRALDQDKRRRAGQYLRRLRRRWEVARHRTVKSGAG
jgi:hypothetical protein